MHGNFSCFQHINFINTVYSISAEIISYSLQLLVSCCSSSVQKSTFLLLSQIFCPIAHLIHMLMLLWFTLQKISYHAEGVCLLIILYAFSKQPTPKTICLPPKTCYSILRGWTTHKIPQFFHITDISSYDALLYWDRKKALLFLCFVFLRLLILHICSIFSLLLKYFSI